MLIKINSVDDIFPSLEALGNLGVTFKTNDDDSVVIDLNAPKFKVVENKDIPILLSSNFENADSSLLYFIIKENRIIASGDLKKISDNEYECNGALRVFSKINVNTTDYLLAGQNEVSELDYLNGVMLDATAKDNKKIM